MGQLRPDGTRSRSRWLRRQRSRLDQRDPGERSRDGGATWDQPIALRQDGDAFSTTRKRHRGSDDARYAYAIWERVNNLGALDGPVWFARTTDGGDSWEPARMIYDRVSIARRSTTRSSCCPTGRWSISSASCGSSSRTSVTLSVMRSTDKGLSWSAPIEVTPSRAVGAFDPEGRIRIRDGLRLGHIAADRHGTLFIVLQDAAATRTGFAMRC
jgi:hypothetical protein